MFFGGSMASIGPNSGPRGEAPQHLPKSIIKTPTTKSDSKVKDAKKVAFNEQVQAKIGDKTTTKKLKGKEVPQLKRTEARVSLRPVVDPHSEEEVSEEFVVVAQKSKFEMLNSISDNKKGFKEAVRDRLANIHQGEMLVSKTDNQWIKSRIEKYILVMAENPNIRDFGVLKEGLKSLLYADVSNKSSEHLHLKNYEKQDENNYNVMNKVVEKIVDEFFSDPAVTSLFQKEISDRNAKSRPRLL